MIRKDQKIRINSKTFVRYWQKENNCIAFELSDLECMGIFVAPANSIIVENTTSGQSRKFDFTHSDTDASNEDIYGWNYESKDGIKLLLIND